MEIKAGTEFRVAFPFYQGVHVRNYSYDDPDYDDVWIPGCKPIDIPPDDAGLAADGIGEMILSIVDVHRPGKYPERVFYTRKWVDPDGKVFGSTKLHITTTPTFKKRAAGYYHEYELL